MPFPWKKKSRVARISQRLVADLQSPRKRGRSLVVETGFPTSLVDLIVKNKNRIRKPSGKRKQDKDQECWEISEPVLTSPLPPHLASPGACADLVQFKSGGSGSSSSDGTVEVVEEEEEEEVGVARSGEDDGSGGNSGRHGVFVTLLRMFVVVILGLSSKRFAAGITVSAVSLLLLELIGKWVVGSVMPCSDALASFECLINGVCGFFEILCLRWKKCKEGRSLDEEEDCVSLKGEAIVVERDAGFGDWSLTDKSCQTDEAVRADEELINGADHESVDCERRRDSLDSWIKMKYTGSSECEDRKHDQSIKHISRLMQKIVPKKLKHPKAGWKRNTVSVVVPSEAGKAVEDNYESVEEEVQAPLAKEQLGKWSGDVKKNDEKMTNEDYDEITTEVAVEPRLVDGRRERRQRMALMVTFTMILASLIGGRFLAVVLTTGYFGSKFVGSVMT